MAPEGLAEGDDVYRAGDDTAKWDLPGFTLVWKRLPVTADYQHHQGQINERTAVAGIQNDLGGHVKSMIDSNRAIQHQEQNQIAHQYHQVDDQRSDLQQHHVTAKSHQYKIYAEEKNRQERFPGADTLDEMINRTKSMQDEFNKGRGGK